CAGDARDGCVALTEAGIIWQHGGRGEGCSRPHIIALTLYMCVSYMCVSRYIAIYMCVSRYIYIYIFVCVAMDIYVRLRSAKRGSASRMRSSSGGSGLG